MEELTNLNKIRALPDHEKTRLIDESLYKGKSIEKIAKKNGICLGALCYFLSEHIMTRGASAKKFDNFQPKTAYYETEEEHLNAIFKSEKLIGIGSMDNEKGDVTIKALYK